jgi:methylglutaconyl-CoA hydratase
MTTKSRVISEGRYVDYQSLQLDIGQGIATIWMNRPDRHNAFDETLIAELDDAVQRLDNDPNARVIVLGGRGKSFSAGADLNWMRRAAGYGVEENLRDARALARMLRSIDRAQKPTIARVHGAALGGGTGLVCACDIAIATTDATFATTEVKFGIVPATIGPYVVRAIGERNARRYFLTAERLDADEARRIGMVHDVCAPDAIDARISALASTLLIGGPKAQAAAKQLIRTVSPRAVDDAMIEETAQCIANLRSTPEAAEGIAAFLERRQPAWQIK